MSCVFLLKQKVFIQEEKKGLWNQKGLSLTSYEQTGIILNLWLFTYQNVYPVVRAKREASVSKRQVLSRWAILSLPFAKPFLQP